MRPLLPSGFLAFVLAAASLAFAPMAHAQDFPVRPVRMVSPGAAGTGLDFIGRALAQAMEKQLGQAVVYEPEPGAGALIAHRRVAKREAADGYTILFTASVYFTHGIALKEPGYDVERDFAPVSLVATGPFALVTGAASPFATFNDLVSHAKANPGKLNYGVAGPADALTLNMESIKRKKGLDMVGIAYKRGTPDWMAGLLANDLQLSFGAFTSVLPLVQDGKLRVLAVAGDQRAPQLPDVPSFAELGLPEIKRQAFVMFTVAGTPPAVVEKLSGAINRSLQSPELRAAVARAGFTPVGSTPAALAQRVREEVGFYRTVAREASVQPQ